jgi:tetratricopeptide (TPR) repeat protein
MKIQNVEWDNLIDDTMALYKQKDYVKATAIAKKALVIIESIAGPNHPDVATNLNIIALLLKNQSQYDQAEVFYRRSLATLEKLFGSNHLDVAAVLNNIALLYKIQKKYEEAEKLYKQSLAIQENLLGIENNKLIPSLINIATFYREQQFYCQAELYYRRLLSIREKTFGAESLDVAASFTLLASLYEEQKNYNYAETYYHKSLVINEKLLGHNHTEVATIISSLANIFTLQRSYNHSEVLYEDLLSIMENIHSLDDPIITTTIDNLAKTKIFNNKLQESEILYNRSLTIRKNAFGESHSMVAKSLLNLGELYSYNGSIIKAEHFLKQSLDIYDINNDANPRDIIRILDELIGIAQLQENYIESESYYTRLISIYETIFPSNEEDESEFICAFLNLAKLYYKQGKYNLIEPFCENSLNIIEKTFGPTHQQVAVFLSNVADLYKLLGENKKAKLLLTWVKEINDIAFKDEYEEVDEDEDPDPYVYKELNLEPIGQIDAKCPYCLKYLKHKPARKTKCPNCNMYMYVRTRPCDHEQVSVTVQQIELIEEQWSIVNGYHDKFIAERERIRYEKIKLSELLNRTPNQDEIKMNLYNQDLIDYMENQDFRRFNDTKIELGKILLNNENYYDALTIFIESTYLGLNGPLDRTQFINHSLWDPKLSKGDITYYSYLFSEVMSKYKISMAEIEEIYKEKTSPLHIMLNLPLSPDQLWPTIRKAIMKVTR